MLDRKKLLMYAGIVPYTITSLMGAACAPKTITSATPTLTERTQEIPETNLSRELGSLATNLHYELDRTASMTEAKVIEKSDGPLYFKREITPEFFRMPNITDTLRLTTPSLDINVQIVMNHNLTYLVLRRFDRIGGLHDWFIDYNFDGRFDRGLKDRPAELYGFNSAMLIDSDKMVPEDRKTYQDRFEDSLRRVIATR